jgi:hypothetical protein
VESWPRKWHQDAKRQPYWVLESDFYYNEAWYSMRVKPLENQVYQQGVRLQGPKGYFMGPDNNPEPDTIEGGSHWDKNDTVAGRLAIHDHLAPIYLESRLEGDQRVIRAWRAFGFANLGLGDYFHNMYNTYRFRDDLPVHRDFAVPLEDLKTPAPRVDFHRGNEHFVNLIDPALPKLAQPSPMFTRLRDQALAPFIAFIVHKGKVFEDFTQKDHAFASGQQIEKQVVLINDHADSRKATFEVTFGPKGGAARSVLKQDVELQSGETRFLPCAVEAPQTAGRADYELKLSWSVADGEIAKLPDNLAGEVNATFAKTGTDVFALQIFPAEKAAIAAKNLKIGIYDEIGKTKALLQQLGLQTVDLATAVDLAAVNLVVVGRESLTASFGAVFSKLGIADKLASGAADLLVFEQTRASAPSLAPDLDDLSVRDVFPLDAAHPILAGLKDEDFKDWRGESDLLKPMPSNTYFWMPGTRRFQKWTNEGIVASVLLRKPHYGNFRPLVESDFDLWGTSLLECFVGKGSLVFCQLDVTTGRYGSDPALTRVVRNLFEYFDGRAGKPKPERFRPVYLVGSGSKILDERGVQYAPFTGAEKAGTLVLSGAPKEALLAKANEIRQFAQEGGVVLYFVDSPGAFADALLPVKVTAEEKKAFRFSLAPGEEATRGLSHGDLFFRTMPAFVTFAGEGKPLTQPGLLHQVDCGKGRFVLAPALDADAFADTWWAAKVCRLQSILLTNLGVRQAPPDFAFLSKGKSDTAAGCAHWDFETDMGGWSGAEVSGEKAYGGKKCAKLRPRGGDVWDRGGLELAADPKKGEIPKLGRDTAFCFAVFTSEAVGLVATVQTDTKSYEFEFRTAAGEWLPVQMLLASFAGSAQELEGRTLKALKLRWGGLEDAKRPVEVFIDDAMLGPARKSLFKRYGKTPAYDPSYYTTW